MKEIKVDLHKWKDKPCSPIRFNVIKMAVFSKLIHRFNTIPIKISAGFLFFAELDKLILKFIQKFKKFKNIQNNLGKEHLPISKPTTKQK